MKQRLLICTDLDRTLIPNGTHPESLQARALFARLVARDDVNLVYVSGRDQRLTQQAINEYQLPTPDYVIADVGSSIYAIVNQQWHPWPAWQDEIATDWQGNTHDNIAKLFTDMDGLQLQEAEKQNVFKLSYYVPANIDSEALRSAMQARLQQQAIRASLIWSIDDITHSGLLDVLPRRATKLHAIEFLMAQKAYAIERTIFAGDSGNDIPVLTSRIQSVLVANARQDVREQAAQEARKNGLSDALYFAKGDFMGMNGNYAAGILEGIAHFIPETTAWLSE
ncbi:MAG: HAD-IIB family hydrolase [Gammaproteobacteria bacterium]|nr:HAD-IIB family hydrolase [Gammaproteobacteria bacterium]